MFWAQDGDGHPYSADRLPRLRKMIERTLKGEIVAREALAGPGRDKPKKRNSAFRFPTHIIFDNEGSDVYTVIEVDTRDRPGLLYDLTRTLAENHIQIASAVIATFGAQVVDTFYVKDMFGLETAPAGQARGAERNCGRRSRTAPNAPKRPSAPWADRSRIYERQAMQPIRLIRGFLSVGAWTLASRISWALSAT